MRFSATHTFVLTLLTASVLLTALSFVNPMLAIVVGWFSSLSIVATVLIA